MISVRLTKASYWLKLTKEQSSQRVSLFWWIPRNSYLQHKPIALTRLKFQDRFWWSNNSPGRAAEKNLTLPHCVTQEDSDQLQSWEENYEWKPNLSGDLRTENKGKPRSPDLTYHCPRVRDSLWRELWKKKAWLRRRRAQKKLSPRPCWRRARRHRKQPCLWWPMGRSLAPPIVPQPPGSKSRAQLGTQYSENLEGTKPGPPNVAGSYTLDAVGVGEGPARS